MECIVWEESGYDRSLVSEPTSSEVTQALRLMNGSERNDLYLRCDLGSWMGFGGGPDQVIVTYSESREGPHYQAVQTCDRGHERTVTMRVGGQEAESSSRYLINLDSATRAALSFLETRHRPEELLWEQC